MTAIGQPFPHLVGHQYMNLTTFRKSGVAVPTPVWFAEQDGTLYVVTLGTSGKAKRIRNNGHVLVEPSDARGKPLGAEQRAVARILPEDERPRGHYALMHKYKVGYSLFSILWYLRGTIKDTVYLEIAPADAAEHSQ